MKELLERIALCVEQGKVDVASPYPSNLSGQEGADELTRKALEGGIPPNQILADALITGMERIGIKFRENQVFLPEVLMAAKAMTAAMNHLKPFFTSGAVKPKGLILMGTVAGDLHDIGKKIVGMFFEGGGWEVIDLGVDIGAEKYLQAIEKHKPNAVGLSALLTTTMTSMEEITKKITSAYPKVKVLIGGAPVTPEFADKIGAHCYSPDPQGALDYLNSKLTINN
jgi:5-methyltetrahydrofolate--homocysteine methyltransferase